MIDTSDFTMKNILANMLSRIPDTLDKREGSIIYDALAPAAYELSAAYRYLAECMKQCFAATATGDFLELRVAEAGLTRQPATKAVRLATFTDSSGLAMDVLPGTRFSTLDGADSLNFCVLSRVSNGVFWLEAEEAGAAANEYAGDLLPITYVEGLGGAVMSAAPVTDGMDAESDAALRSRYFSVLGQESKTGNAAQYQQWATSFPGIGRAKVFPAWNGANTVKVSILNSSQGVASSTLMADFQDALDPNQDGLGAGLAPVGAVATVTTASVLTVDVAAFVTLNSGYDTTQALSNVESAIAAYFAQIAYAQLTVNSIEIGAAILGLEAIATVSELTVNNATSVSLTAEQIPALGTMTLEVVS